MPDDRLPTLLRAAMGDLERAVLATVTGAELAGFRAVTQIILEVLR